MSTENEAQRVARLTRSFDRARWVLLALALALPLALHLLFAHAATQPELSAEQAASKRSIALEVELGVAAFFLLNLLLTEVKRRKLLRDGGWSVSPRVTGRVVAVLLIGCAIAADLAPESGLVFAKAFGQAPLGIPVVPLVTGINVLLLLPYLWVFEHLMRILTQASKDRVLLSRMGIAAYVWDAARLHPELVRSRRIVLAGFVYFVLLAGAWIAYAEARGV